MERNYVKLVLHKSFILQPIKNEKRRSRDGMTKGMQTR